MSSRLCVSISLFLFYGAGTTAQAQDTLRVNKPMYYGSFASGALFGDHTEALTASLLTIHGVCINRFRAGAGVGLDGYEDWRVVPVFLSVSYDIVKLRNNNAVFVQLNGGYAAGEKLKKEENVVLEKEEGGVMINPLVGYRIQLHQKYSLHVAIGHKLQRTKYSFEYSWWNYRYTVDQELNRFYFLIGVGIN